MCTGKTKTATMPQNDALLKAVETLSTQIQSFHNDFKQSFYYLVDTLNHHHDTENGEIPATPPTPSQVPIFSATPARTSAGVHRGREPFKFSSEEKEKETKFDKDVTKCIDSVAAEWKKLTKANSSNTHKSIRNMALASKYREWLQKEPPFFIKKFRPTPTQPENQEIDAIRVEQAKAFVENECRVMSLHARNAQKANDALEDQMKILIQGATSDDKVKDELFRRWNDEKLEGESRELKKWEEKEKWFDKLPTNPSLEDVQEQSTAPKAKSAKSGPTSESNKSSESRENNAKRKKPSPRPEPNQSVPVSKKKKKKGQNPQATTGANPTTTSANQTTGANQASGKRPNRKKPANSATTNPPPPNGSNKQTEQNHVSAEPDAQNAVFRKRKPHPNRRKKPKHK